ncbi:aminotransferase class IV [Clostridium akagii]|uniref:aminotransferase class IV n=1 Tax=Clostridium akagii TaxID=91623 RepID=UPI00047C8BC8|nr:aminotransferase class IV [Clostridium akagii]
MVINLINCDKKKVEFDSGFYFGKGLFETILVLKNPAFLDEHLNRLNQGLIKLGIKNIVSKEMVLEELHGVENCAVKIMVSDKNIVFTRRDLSYTKNQYDMGFKVKLSKLKRDPQSHMVYLKSFNYMDNIIERELAIKEGYDEVLFMNTENLLGEGSISNVFVIMEDSILTPSIECGILNGTVRNFIIRKLGIKYNIIEGKFSLEKIKKCKGMFITNSLMGIMWINSFNEINLMKTKIYEEIRNFYEDFEK